MYRITIAVLLSTAVGCSTSRSATGGGAEREGNGTVAGLITLADGVAPKTGDFCAGLTVKVTSAGVPGETLGDRMVKVSRGRCSYQVAHLPTDTELQLAVTPSAAWTCDNGATPTLTPDTQTLSLRDYEALTRDYRVTCPAPEAAAPATP